MSSVSLVELWPSHEAMVLREAVLAYQDALPVLAQQHLGRERMAALDEALEHWLPSLTAAPAYPYPRGQFVVRWVDGTAPQTAIEGVTWYRGKQSLLKAEDPGRRPLLAPQRHHATVRPKHALPWLPDVQPALEEASDVRNYLERLTKRVKVLKERVVVEAQPSASGRAPCQRGLPQDVGVQLVGDLAGAPPTSSHPPTPIPPDRP